MKVCEFLEKEGLFRKIYAVEAEDAMRLWGLYRLCKLRSEALNSQKERDKTKLVLRERLMNVREGLKGWEGERVLIVPVGPAGRVHGNGQGNSGLQPWAPRAKIFCRRAMVGDLFQFP